MIRQYSEENISVRKLAEQHEVSLEIIYGILRRNNVARTKKRNQTNLDPLRTLEIDQTIITNLPKVFYGLPRIHTAARKLNIKVQVRQIRPETYTVKRIT